MEGSFTQWMREVDANVWRLAGVSAHDLPDQTYRDWYECEYEPEDAAEEALSNAGFPVNAG